MPLFRFDTRSLATTLSLSLLALLTLGPPAGAQDGSVRGIVTDSLNAPVPDADVAIATLHQLTRTDKQGRFTFDKVPRGEYEVSIRKLGFQPEKVMAAVNELTTSYAVTLRSHVVLIEGVNVSATEMRLRLGIEDFYRRRIRANGGTFFTRDDIAARNAKRTSDVLRQVSGVQFVRTRDGQGLRFTGNGTDRRGCTPTVWLDGQPVENLEVDAIPVTDIEGVEIYAGSSTTPMQFSQRSNKPSCGAIIIWSRIPGGA